MFDMNNLRSFIIAIVILICGLVYVISPIDLLPGIPIDDILVGIGTIVGSIKEFKEAKSSCILAGSCDKVL